MNGFWTALAFLTVLPARGGAFEPARAVGWYPVVGLVLGGVLAGVAAGAWWALAPLPAAALVVTAWAILTGALHLDGLADTADAAFAPVTPERRRAILRDVHHGTFAIVAVAAVLILKTSALASVGSEQAVALVLAGPVVARAAVVLVLRWFAAPEGSRLAAGARGTEVAAPIVAIVVALGAAAVTLGWPGLLLTGGAGVLALALAAFLARRFEGVGGDACGAIIETVEVAWLLAAGALLHHGLAGTFRPWESP